MSATIAPRIEIYTMLACSVHKPDIFRQNFPGIELGLHSTIHEISGLDFRVPSSDIPTSSNIHMAHVFPGIYPFLDSPPKNGSTPPPKKGNLCASDPVVLAAVAKLTAGKLSLYFFVIIEVYLDSEAWIFRNRHADTTPSRLWFHTRPGPSYGPPYLSGHFADGINSHYYFHGHSKLHHDRVVGCCESPRRHINFERTSIIV
jgi:hypothetical protein